MTDNNNNNQPVESFLNYVRITNLPYGITAKEITGYFDSFGIIKKLYLKRRINKDSPIFLPNPSVTLLYEDPDSVDQIMAIRPVYIGDRKLTIRRVLPITPRYPHEPFISVKKILIRTQSENNDEILPGNQSIVDYLAHAGGSIDYFERLNNKTVLVQFDDYDPVDICCLSRPHFINNQPVEIEKCSDEEQVRKLLEFQEKSNSISDKSSNTIDTVNQTMNSVSPTPILSIDDQLTQLRSKYSDITNRFEREHEQLLTSLSNEWKQTAKERFRLQRLTLDYQQEHQRITDENRKWKKLFSESLKEKPMVQTEGDQKLKDASLKTDIAKAKYDQLNQNIRQ